MLGIVELFDNHLAQLYCLDAPKTLHLVEFGGDIKAAFGADEGKAVFGSRAVFRLLLLVIDQKADVIEFSRHVAYLGGGGAMLFDCLERIVAADHKACREHHKHHRNGTKHPKRK